MIPMAFVITLIWTLHILCAEMTTGTTAVKTTMTGTWAKNELYELYKSPWTLSDLKMMDAPVRGREKAEDQATRL